MAYKAHILLVSGILILSLNLSAQEVKPPANTKQKTPVKIIKYIVGTWQLKEVYKGNKSVPASDTVSYQTIEFNREGRFVSHSSAVKTDSGAYRINEEHSILYLESTWRDNPPSEWNVRFKSNRMTLQRKDSSPQAESYQYVYSRKGISTR